MSEPWETEQSEELLNTILQLGDLGMAKRFFRDLLTENEIREFAARWQAARLLDGGSSYVEVQKRSGLSSATVARISRWLSAGAGGYRAMIDKLHHAQPPSHSGTGVR